MSVQFLEARACQRHDLGEPVFGDGVLSMIVVPRRFTPCDRKGSRAFLRDKTRCRSHYPMKQKQVFIAVMYSVCSLYFFVD